MRFVYPVSRFFMWCFCKVWFRASVTGLEHVPADGSVLMACNHFSHLDPPLMGIFLKRRCRYVARASLGRIPLVGSWMRAVGVIFIDRKAPSRAAIDAVIEALGEGEIAGMFPEGTRSRDGQIGQFQRGILLLLKKSQARVVPVGIRGSFSALPPGASIPRPRKVSVHYGKPWSAQDVLAPGGLEALRQEIAELSGAELS